MPTDINALGLNLDQPICYVMETQSISNLVVLDLQCKKLGLPSPRAALGQNVLKQWPATYSLTHTDNGHGDSSKLNELLRFVQQSDNGQDIQLVPVFVLWGRPVARAESWIKALFSDSWQLTGRIRKLFTILLHGRNVWLQFTAPISLQKELQTSAWVGLDQRLNEAMKERLVGLRRATIGPDLSHRRTLVDELLKTASVKKAVLQASKDEGLAKDLVVARARHYANEIAANYNSATINTLDVILRWLWNKLYDGVEVHHVEQLQAMAADNSIVYVPCHRSHIDYMLLSYVLYSRGIVPPHIAAGINLNMPIIGSILRGGGAFFMRRSFKGDRLYTTVFNEYLHANFIRGVSIEYFVEGGRSRSGRLMRPRPGMLQMTVRSFLRDSTRPIAFVPIYIGYEKLIESQTFMRELSGKKKARENIFSMIRAFLKLRGSFGKVYLNFGEPILLADILDGQHPGWQEEKYNTDYRPEWLYDSVHQLGQRIANGINSAAAVHPVNLIALALLSTPKRAMGAPELAHQLDLYLQILKKLPYSSSVTLPEMNGEEMITYVEKTGILQRHEHKMGDVVYLNNRHAILITYYRNNIAHLFTLPSLVACCFLNKRMLPESSVKHLVKRLYPFLKSELTLRFTAEELDSELQKTIQVFLEMQLLTQRQDNKQLQRPISTTLEAMQLTVLAENVRPMLERYYMGIFLLQQYGSGTLTADELETHMHNMAQRISMLFELNSPDYFDKNLFTSFTEVLLSEGYVNSGDNDKLYFDQALTEFNADTKVILNQQLRHSIHQIARPT